MNDKFDIPDCFDNSKMYMIGDEVLRDWPTHNDRGSPTFDFNYGSFEHVDTENGSEKDSITEEINRSIATIDQMNHDMEKLECERKLFCHEKRLDDDIDSDCGNNNNIIVDVNLFLSPSKEQQSVSGEEGFTSRMGKPDAGCCCCSCHVEKPKKYTRGGYVKKQTSSYKSTYVPKIKKANVEKLKSIFKNEDFFMTTSTSTKSDSSFEHARTLHFAFNDLNTTVPWETKFY